MASLASVYDIGWKIARLEARRGYIEIGRLVVDLILRDSLFRWGI